MFSQSMASLRKEAEKVSIANHQLMANEDFKQTNGEGGRETANRFSGEAARDKTLKTGFGMSMGGVAGLMALTAGNQALALGTSATLAKVGAVMAGLGTVTVAGAAIPAATIVAVGAGVSGLAVMGISRLMKVNTEKGADYESAFSSRDKNAITELGRQNIGLDDWLKGAKNYVINTTRAYFQGRDQQFCENRPEQQRLGDQNNAVARSGGGLTNISSIKQRLMTARPSTQEDMHMIESGEKSGMRG